MMNTHAGQPATYNIKIAGPLDALWQAWFEGLTISATDDGNTLLQGPIRDQAALHGVLRKINNLGLTLLAVHRQPAAESAPAGHSDRGVETRSDADAA